MKKIKEWNGDNRAYGKNFGGGFVGGGDLSKYSGQIDTYPFKATKLTGADTSISQRTGLVSSSYEGDYYEGEEEMDDNEELELETLLECFVNKNISKSTFRLINEQDDSKVPDLDNKSATLARLGKAAKTALTKKETSKFLSNPAVKSAIEAAMSTGATKDAAIKAVVSGELGAGVRSVGTAKASFLSKIPGFAKIAGAAIPVLDIGIAIGFIVSSLKQINQFNRVFNSALNLQKGSELPNYLIDAQDREFDELLIYINKLFSSPEYDAIQGQLKDQFNDILLVFKDLFMTMLVAINPYITGGIGSVVPVLGTALGYLAGKGAGITGALAIHSIPAERLLFELSSEIASGIESAFKIFEKDEQFKEGSNQIQRDSLAYCFIANFTQSLDRMGKIYKAIYEGEDTAFDKAVGLASSAIDKIEESDKKTKKIIDDLNEYEDYAAKINALNRKLNKQREDQLNYLSQEINEFSGAGSIGGGPVTPIGTNAYGKRETPKARKKRQEFNRTKSFPYWG